MQGNRSRDTVPELALRSAVHALGLRYRVGVRPIPSLRRTADLVFTNAKIAVFMDGCFWHGCPDHHRSAAANAQYWAEKVVQNRQRDYHTNRVLEANGWMAIRVWEHEDPRVAALRVADAWRERRKQLVSNTVRAISGMS
jgi:DNA mismatch endonuclease, patch repair protein